MSRYYEMQIEIEDFDPSRADQIEEAAEKEWSFENGWFGHKDNKGVLLTLSNSGRANLTGGESEEEFVRRLTEAVWKANRGFCRVGVYAIYLEDPPCEHHELGEEEYQRFIDLGAPFENEEENNGC